MFVYLVNKIPCDRPFDEVSPYIVFTTQKAVDKYLNGPDSFKPGSGITYSVVKMAVGKSKDMYREIVYTP